VLGQLKQQGNASNIPGLSNPTNNLANFKVPTTQGMAYPTLAATGTASAATGALSGGYPSFNSGAATTSATGYPTLSGG